MDLVENTHGLINTEACRRDIGPCQKHARTDEYSSKQKKTLGSLNYRSQYLYVSCLSMKGAENNTVILE